jgi:hypothetical protein
MRRPGHPGTAVRIGEDLFEVVAAEKSGDEWVYRLEPWTGLDTIRVYVEWGERSEREFIAALRGDRAHERKSFLAWAAQPFLGFLPAKDQRRLSQTAGMDPGRATFWSAALETAVAFPFAVLFVINMVTAGAGGMGLSIPAWAGLLAMAGTFEGAFRLAAALSTGEPMGSLALAFLDFRLRSKDPRYVPADEILPMGDVLDVVSPVPKVWWERAGGVTFRGEPYFLAGSGREKAGFSYRFRKSARGEGGEGEGAGERFPVLDPEMEKVRNRSSELSYVFAPIWGFLPAAMQKSLEFYGRYRPRPCVVLSVTFDFLAAFAMVGSGLRDVSLGVSEIGSFILLAAAAAFFGEGLVRLLRLIWDGTVTGSLLAFLVKPIYRRAIKDGPVPPS